VDLSENRQGKTGSLVKGDVLNVTPFGKDVTPRGGMLVVVSP
jgi:hypothetical protein